MFNFLYSYYIAFYRLLFLPVIDTPCHRNVIDRLWFWKPPARARQLPCFDISSARSCGNKDCGCVLMPLRSGGNALTLLG